MNAKVEDQEVMEFLSEVAREYIRAREKFHPFHNAHEGYAVLLEEVDELWEEVKHPTSYKHFREELVQIAAMSLAMAKENR